MEVKGKWRVYLVNQIGERVGDAMTLPQSFASAVSFCRGYLSNSSDIANGLIPVPFQMPLDFQCEPDEAMRLQRAPQVVGNAGA
jgi:hypothetical protein